MTKRAAYLLNVNHFKSKPEKGDKDYFTACITLAEEFKDENFRGLCDPITVWLTQQVYLDLYDGFTPFQEIMVCETIDPRTMKAQYKIQLDF